MCSFSKGFLTPPAHQVVRGAVYAELPKPHTACDGCTVNEGCWHNTELEGQGAVDTRGQGAAVDALGEGKRSCFAECRDGGREATDCSRT